MINRVKPLIAFMRAVMNQQVGCCLKHCKTTGLCFVKGFLINRVVFVNAHFQQFANQARRGFDGFDLWPQLGMSFHQAAEVVPGSAFSFSQASKDERQAQVQKARVFNVCSQFAVFAVAWIDWMVSPELCNVICNRVAGGKACKRCCRTLEWLCLCDHIFLVHSLS